MSSKVLIAERLSLAAARELDGAKAWIEGLAIPERVTLLSEFSAGLRSPVKVRCGSVLGLCFG